jgi:hypothetical protein
MYFDRSHHRRETVLLTVPTSEKQIFHSNCTWWSSSVSISADIMGIQKGEVSKLGWPIGWFSRDMWADSLYFLHVVLGSVCETLPSFQHILWPSSYACWANETIDNVQEHNNCTNLPSSQTLIIWILKNSNYFLPAFLEFKPNKHTSTRLSSVSHSTYVDHIALNAAPLWSAQEKTRCIIGPAAFRQRLVEQTV